MHEREAHKRYERLVADLDSIRELLAAYGERHWSAWVDAVRGEVTARDAQGLTRLLQAYGAMGSLNDVYLHSQNHQVVSEAEHRSDNDRFEELRSRMWADATALLRSLDRDV